MSGTMDLDKLSVKQLCARSEYHDYLVSLEIEEKSSSRRFVVYYGVLQAHWLFLFDHESAEQCRQAVNLASTTIKVFLDKLNGRWPGGCIQGCKLVPTPADHGEDETEIHQQPQQQQPQHFGFFPGSDWPNQFGPYATGRITDSNSEPSAELLGLFGANSNLPGNNSSTGRLSMAALSAAAAAAALSPQFRKPLKPPKPGTGTDPPQHTTPPSDSLKPPSDPTKPPSNPLKPPSDPLKPPLDLEKPPSDTLKPPSDPPKPPLDLAKPPSDPLKPPLDSAKPFSDPPKSPLDPPKPFSDPPKPPSDPPKSPLDPPKPFSDPPKPPSDPPKPPSDPPKPPLDLAKPPSDPPKPPSDPPKPPSDWLKPPSDPPKPPLDPPKPPSDPPKPPLDPLKPPSDPPKPPSDPPKPPSDPPKPPSDPPKPPSDWLKPPSDPPKPPLDPLKPPSDPPKPPSDPPKPPSDPLKPPLDPPKPPPEQKQTQTQPSECETKEANNEAEMTVEHTQKAELKPTSELEKQKPKLPTRRASQSTRDAQLLQRQKPQLINTKADPAAEPEAATPANIGLALSRTTPTPPTTPGQPHRPSTGYSSISSTDGADSGDAPPPLPPKPNSWTPLSPLWQNASVRSPDEWDLRESLAAGLPGDPVCGYLCGGYFTQTDVELGKKLMKRARDSGAYMLRGFCSKQSKSGQERELCVRHDSIVSKFRIRLTPKGYQVWNDYNERLHFSMEALLFYHHIFPIRVAKPQEHEILLRRPYDITGQWENRNHLTNLLRASLWYHGSKEHCAEILKSSPEEGTYALRNDTEGQAVAVLCVTHRYQLLKLRINSYGSSTDSERKQYAFQNEADHRKFSSIEELIVYHHKNPICEGPQSQQVILRVPFQLVPRCQQELSSRCRPIDSVLLPAPANSSQAALDAAEAEAADRVLRMQGGNFLLLLRRKDSSPSAQQQQQQPAQKQRKNSLQEKSAEATAQSANRQRKYSEKDPLEFDSALTGPAVEHALLLVRDDAGIVQTFRVTERETDLSFGPAKLYSLYERPQLLTNKLEKMISLLCVSARILSPDIMCLVMS